MENITVERLRDYAEAYVRDEPQRLGTDGWWRIPILATAPVDSRFSRLPKIASPDHLHPADLLPSAKTVIVFFIPFQPGLVRENADGTRPCRNWGLAYVQTNDLINRLSKVLGKLLESCGFKSGLTPATHNFDEVQLTARWSHKHLGYLVNLGRFGVHHMLITPQGCAGRLGSLVTEASLGDNPVIEAEETCLLKYGMECGKCISACPMQALNEHGFERRICWERLKDNLSRQDCFAGIPDTTHVCGKCAAGMPCSFRNPVAFL